MAAFVLAAAEKAFLARVLGPAASLSPLSPDGSGRRFFRAGNGRIVVLPDPGNPAGLAEARAFFRIGRHLARQGCPVPEIYFFDPASGAAVCEDGGTFLLHDIVRAEGFSRRVTAIYRRVAADLARMQTAAARDFDSAWCWQEPLYGREVMLEKESRYFLEEFVRGEAGIAAIDPRLEDDFVRLADLAAGAGPLLFMHRDFQSRNIVVGPADRHLFIDFQGGRTGPAAYDLASLLNDPYVSMPDGLRKELRTLYLDTLAAICDIDSSRFGREYRFLAIQRLMQALGAFAKLARGGRERFRRYMAPALDGLDRLLAECDEKFPALAALVEELRERGRRKGWTR